jgi:hypothetical protein
MTARGCWVCGAAPSVNRRSRPAIGGVATAKSPKQIAAEIKAARDAGVEAPQVTYPTRSVQLFCASGVHPMLKVETHECGSEEEAIKVWNNELPADQPKEETGLDALKGGL